MHHIVGSYVLGKTTTSLGATHPSLSLSKHPSFPCDLRVTLLDFVQDENDPTPALDLSITGV